VSGQKLSEGDGPYVQMVFQDSLIPYARHWRKIRAITNDSTGKEYRSRPVKTMPSWASPERPIS
jgi:hypothetical protein